MFSIKECRKILGAKYASVSDQQIVEIRDFLNLLAEIEFNHIIKEANEMKSQASQSSS